MQEYTTAIYKLQERMEQKQPIVESNRLLYKITALQTQ